MLIHLGTVFHLAPARKQRVTEAPPTPADFQDLHEENHPGPCAAQPRVRLAEKPRCKKVTEKIDKISVLGGLDGVLKDLVKIR